MKKSAGILLFKRAHSGILVLLVHPGGPFWKNKDAGSWSVPKGEFTDEEDPLDAAIREFEEETGTHVDGEFTPLTPVKLKSGKVIYAWACEQDLDTDSISSNEFEMEWPPKSGLLKSFPEVDRAEWFPIDMALQKITAAQGNLIVELAQKLSQS